MENKITITIANDDHTLALNIANYVKMQNDMEVVGIAQDGENTIKMIVEKEPNIVLLDLIMPIHDGIVILEKIRELESKGIYKGNTKFMIMAQSTTNSMIEQAVSLGADYILVSPFNIELIIDSIRRVQKSYKEQLNREEVSSNQFQNNSLQAQNIPSFDITESLAKLDTINKCLLNDRDLDSLISIIILKVGIPPNLKGYNYIKEALKLILNDFSILNQITKVLYTEMAEMFKTTPTSIERGIRTAIEYVYSKPSSDLLENLFGNVISPESGRPTNTVFLSILAEEIRLALIHHKY